MAKQWQSSKKDATTASSPAAALQQEQPLLNIYQSISNLPLSIFIDCIVDNNLHALIISGTASDPYQLHKAWSNIMQQYSEAIGAGEYKVYLSLFREVSLLQLDYSAVHHMVECMKTIQEYIVLKDFNCLDEIFTHQQKVGEALNAILKTACKFNNKDCGSYYEELNKCIRRSASIKIKLDLKLLAFEAIQNKNKNGGVMDRAYFDSMLITISDHAKYEIGENITVSKYCERIKRYNQYYESLKSSKK